MVVSTHVIRDISYCSQDIEDKRVFAYITKDKSGMNYCHVFVPQKYVHRLCYPCPRTRDVIIFIVTMMSLCTHTSYTASSSKSHSLCVSKVLKWFFTRTFIALTLTPFIPLTGMGFNCNAVHSQPKMNTTNCTPFSILILGFAQQGHKCMHP